MKFLPVLHSVVVRIDNQIYNQTTGSLVSFLQTLLYVLVCIIFKNVEQSTSICLYVSEFSDSSS